MNIRQATLEDLPQLAHLWQERMTIRVQSDSRIASIQPPFEIWLDSLTEQMTTLQDYCVLVACGEDRIVGYIIGSIKSSDVAVVDDLILDAHTYYAGLGRNLWNALYQWFQEKNVQRIIVSVPRFHAVEQAFWRALGATEWKESPWQTIPALMWMTF